jgi:hypothetical protein
VPGGVRGTGRRAPQAPASRARAKAAPFVERQANGNRRLEDLHRIALEPFGDCAGG